MRQPNFKPDMAGKYQDISPGVAYMWTGKTHIIRGIGIPYMQIKDAWDAERQVTQLLTAIVNGLFDKARE